MPLTYLRCEWLHEDPQDPVVFYIELDEGRWEVRKVEVFRDGRMGWADADHEVGGCGLGEAEVPPLDEIAADPEFRPSTISRDEFESVWQAAIERSA